MRICPRARIQRGFAPLIREQTLKKPLPGGVIDKGSLDRLVCDGQLIDAGQAERGGGLVIFMADISLKEWRII